MVILQDLLVVPKYHKEQQILENPSVRAISVQWSKVLLRAESGSFPPHYFVQEVTAESLDTLVHQPDKGFVLVDVVVRGLPES